VGLKPVDSAAADPTDESVLAAYPDTPIDQDNIGIYRGWLVKQLRVHRCADCGHRHHPPQPCCPRCWSPAVRSEAVSGHGTVHSVVLLHHGPPTTGVSYSPDPHPVVTVELAEQPGLRWTSTLIDRGADSIHVGDPVELAWSQRQGQPFPVFQRSNPP
jgi:hypothetical protein